jgi:alanine racemase
LYRSYAEIDLAAIRGNIRHVAGLLPQNTAIMAVVKANGYGHGVLPVSRAAIGAGARFLAVADVCEGVELRRGGVAAPVLVMGGMLPELAEISVEHDLAQTVYSVEMIDALQRACERFGKRAAIHIKVETGMNRMGVRPGDELQAVLERAKASPLIDVEGLYSHFAVSEIPDKFFTRLQLERYNQAAEQCGRMGFHPLRHIGNSGAALGCPFACLDMVRLGIAMYGLHPSGALDPALRPAFSWKTNVVQVKTVHRGDTVSYGRIWEASGDRVIATLPVGYADGYKRMLGNQAHVLIRGRRAPVVGRVCMDHMMADVTGIEGAATGDEAVLIGAQGDEIITADELAALADTISYEILTTIGDRVKRVWLNE